MKRSLTLLLATLMLTFALTACGSGTDKNQNGTQNETVMDGQTGENHDSGAADSGGSLAEDAGDLVNNGLNGVEDAVDDLTGSTSRTTHRD